MRRICAWHHLSHASANPKTSGTVPNGSHRRPLTLCSRSTAGHHRLRYYLPASVDGLLQTDDPDLPRQMELCAVLGGCQERVACLDPAPNHHVVGTRILKRNRPQADKVLCHNGRLARIFRKQAVPQESAKPHQHRLASPSAAVAVFSALTRTVRRAYGHESVTECIRGLRGLGGFGPSRLQPGSWRLLAFSE